MLTGHSELAAHLDQARSARITDMLWMMKARQTLLLREVDGLQYAEIAETMGIPKGTVMSRLYYARRRVKQSLLELRADGVEQ